MASPAQSRPSSNPLDRKKSLQPRLSSFNINPSAQEKLSKSGKHGGTKNSEPDDLSKKTAPSGKDKPKKKRYRYDEVTAKKLNAMVRGDMRDLPPLPKSMVRIFLSSTFSDMRQERNILVKEAYPKLRNYCAEFGLDFQVVDMRWGVTEDSQNDHSVENLCLLEVKNCQNVSKGPNFVVLSGDRYGFQPIPPKIEVDEFDMIVTMATELKLPNRDLLNTWYLKDENAVPPVYVLQPIRSKFTFFGDYSPGCDEPRKKDTADWWKTFEMLQDILRKSVTELTKQNKMTKERKHTYFYSVTECEIEEGILKASNVNSHCLVYQRELQMLDDSAAGDKDATRFKEFTTKNGASQVDTEVQRLRESLKENKIKSNLSSKNIRRYTVPWMPGGVDPSHLRHKEYLDNFCENFITDCQALVKETMQIKQQHERVSKFYSDYEETIHHLQFCQTKCESFCGQEEILKAVKSYILDESGRRPLIVHAESGAGKTSIMAKIMTNIPIWFNNKPHTKLIRFLGTTPKTNNIYDVLFGVLGQLCDAYGMIMPPVCFKNTKNLVEYIPRYLRELAGNAKEPIVILLDSIDQLNPNNKAYSMEWLPKLLPKNVKLIMSTLPREHGILNNIKKVLPDEECYVHVPVIPNTVAELIADIYLQLNKRQLREKQMKLLISVFKKSPSPLFLKLLLDQAKKWPSYISSVNLDQMPTNIQEAIRALFENLEKKFGQLLVSHALGYITIGLGGLTDIEIEDVLSCDDAVLNDVYRYHDPPVPGHIRVPPLLWARIKFDLKEYLVERLSYGKNTLNWYHRQFIQTARLRYTKDGKDKQLHKNLADMYLQETGIKRSIVLKYRKDLEIPDADRQVTPQPFEAQNHRKLACLTYHAIQGYSVIGPDIVKAGIFCSFKFLCTKIAAFSLTEAISDLSSFLEMNVDEEVTILRNYLSIAKDNLTQPIRLAVCLLAYINPSESHRYLKDLQTECLTYLQGQNTPLLIPEFPCLAPRQDASSALNTSLQGYTSIMAKSENCFLLKAKTDKESSEDNLPEYAIFNTSSEDVQSYDLKGIFKTVSGNNFRLNGKKLFYITKTGLTAYNLHSNKSTTFVFAEKIPKWSPRSSIISHFFMDVESDIGILIMKSFLIHVNLPDMTFVQKFDSRRKFAEIQNCLVFKTVEGFKVVATGTMGNVAENQLQGPEKSSFISIFESGKETPLKFVLLDKKISSKGLVLAASNTWSVGVLNDAEETEVSKIQQPAPCSIFMFKSCPPFTFCDVKVPDGVDKLIGNPNIPEILLLSQNGCVYLTDVDTANCKQAIKLNYPIKNLDVLWEEKIAFLCLNRGNVGIYDLNRNRNLGAFSAHPSPIQDIFIVEQQALTLGSAGDIKLWSIQQLVENVKDPIKEKETRANLLGQMDVLSFSVMGSELITCSRDGYLRIWDNNSHTLLRQFHIEMVISQMQGMVNDVLVLFDEISCKLLVFDVFSGQPVLKTSDVPNKVLTFTSDRLKECIYIISESQKDLVQVDIYNIQIGKFTKSFHIQKGFTYVRLTAMLTLSERFLVLKAEVSDAEYQSIRDMWKKSLLGEQPHKHKFIAVDLSQGNGGVLPCYRKLTKIPLLGVDMCQYKANTVLITTRSTYNTLVSPKWLIQWDIPTGSCIQKTGKGNKSAGMFYRPGWLDQQFKGVCNALAVSNKYEFVVVGSADGYVLIYDAESGMPRNDVKPPTPHKADVHVLAISPNNSWVASGCKGSVLKLWDSSSGKEVFSMRLAAPVQQMTFTADSAKLVLYTGTQTTRVFILKVHEGIH